MGLKISRANQADIPIIVEILSAAVKYKAEHDDYAWGKADDVYTNGEIQPRITAGNTYIAKLGDEVAGTFMLLWDDTEMWGKQPANAGYIHQMAVKAGLHGQHIGERMIDWVASQVLADNRQFVRLDCPPSNERLCGYYESLGFKKVTTREINRPNIKPYLAALYERTVS